MSGRIQALMRTRCPDCGTIFRVTSEQLRLKAGKVRCGQCSRIFNAFDEFLPDGVVPAEREPAEAELASTAVEPPLTEPSRVADIAEPQPLPEVVEPPIETLDPAPLDTATEAIFPEAHDGTVAASETEAEATDVAPEAAIENLLETPEESTLAAREAGLVAARELSDTPGYNRWAAGTLAAGPGGFAGEPPRHAVWPFVLVASLLLLALSGQLLYYFRSDVVLRLPEAARLFELLAIDIPLPRNVDLVAIDT
ncbi:MAG TPA: MJ0042-type zinc finger domain-containing protein, partial [Azonexus sp.]|nr:MJ0042-type zinc finger domain-containing protein [Azonexus sp.]